jgi:hypothetical protein
MLLHLYEFYNRTIAGSSLTILRALQRRQLVGMLLCSSRTDRILNCSGCSYTDLGVDLTNRTWITLQVQTCSGAYVALSSTTSFAGHPLREVAFDWPNLFYSSGYAFAFAYVQNVFFIYSLKLVWASQIIAFIYLFNALRNIKTYVSSPK